jgi:hypothetical protein
MADEEQAETTETPEPIDIVIESESKRRHRLTMKSRAEALAHPLDYAPGGGRYLNAAGTLVDANGQPAEQSR